MAVAEKARFFRQMPADRRQRFIAAGRRDAVRFVEQRLLDVRLAAAPFGDFETRAQLRLRVVKRMREQPRR